ncbi:hypothetical protein Scep_011991 [Stephania cephalantha]|uniref:Uncharacterized protein n=1 Tax=Stephania cephalantha TaxID=152367 RepID=A0AAP0JEC9_9MAGN
MNEAVLVGINKIFPLQVREKGHYWETYYKEFGAAFPLVTWTPSQSRKVNQGLHQDLRIFSYFSITTEIVDTSFGTITRHLVVHRLIIHHWFGLHVGPNCHDTHVQFSGVDTEYPTEVTYLGSSFLCSTECDLQSSKGNGPVQVDLLGFSRLPTRPTPNQDLFKGLGGSQPRPLKMSRFKPTESSLESNMGRVSISEVVAQYLFALALARRKICTWSPNKYSDESSE